MRSRRGGRTSCWLLTSSRKATRREKKKFLFLLTIKLQRLVELLMTRGHCCWNIHSPPGFLPILLPVPTIPSFVSRAIKPSRLPKKGLQHGEKIVRRGSNRIFVRDTMLRYSWPTLFPLCELSMRNHYQLPRVTHAACVYTFRRCGEKKTRDRVNSIQRSMDEKRELTKDKYGEKRV